MINKTNISFDSQEFRQALGCFATGVAIVCAETEKQKPFGITINSFTSLSLNPPLVLWSLQNSADTFAYFEQATHYSVNVLSQHQECLSQQFACRGGHIMHENEFQRTENNCVVLNDCIASFECSIDKRILSGDHTIYIGQVHHFNIMQDKASPLLFYQGAYNTIADI